MLQYVTVCHLLSLLIFFDPNVRMSFLLFCFGCVVLDADLYWIVLLLLLWPCCCDCAPVMVMVFMLSETGTQLVSMRIMRNVHDRCQNYQHEFANSQGSQATTIVKKEMQENADPRKPVLDTSNWCTGQQEDTETSELFKSKESLKSSRTPRKKYCSLLSRRIAVCQLVIQNNGICKMARDNNTNVYVQNPSWLMITGVILPNNHIEILFGNPH